MSTYVPIQAITITSNTATVFFTGIPQTYTDLMIVISGTLTANGNKRIAFNGVSTDQSSTALYANPAANTLLSSRYTGTGTCYLDVYGSLTNRFTNIIHINNYSNATTNKTYISRHGASSETVESIVGLWRSTAAITSIELNVQTGAGAVYASGTTFTLYGVGSGAPKAFGGDRVVTDGTYWYHAFLSSGRFEPVSNLSCDVLVVAGGGGGGGGFEGAGGGAGGIQYLAGASLTSNPYNIVIGAGGPGGPAFPTYGTNGSNSLISGSGFSTITSNGGGGGASYPGSFIPAPGTAGGSGSGGTRGGAGGASNQSSTGGATSYGNSGGAGPGNSGESAGGGGGAGAVGGTATATGGGNGGNGLNTWSTWATATNTGVSGFYAGGGGGGGTSTQGTGGSGGGGAGKLDGPANNAITNTGGGGGGVRNIATGGNGGSGIVIIRYAV